MTDGYELKRISREGVLAAGARDFGSSAPNRSSFALVFNCLDIYLDTF